MISGVGSVVVDMFFRDERDVNTYTQIFYTLAQLFNVILLSDFIHEYVRSRRKDKHNLEFDLPVHHAFPA